MNPLNQMRSKLFNLGVWMTSDPTRARRVTMMLSAGFVVALAIGIIKPCGPMPGLGDGLV